LDIIGEQLVLTLFPMGDGLFWADVDEAGALTVGTYTAGFFGKNPEKMSIWNEVLK